MDKKYEKSRKSLIASSAVGKTLGNLFKKLKMPCLLKPEHGEEIAETDMPDYACGIVKFIRGNKNFL